MIPVVDAAEARVLLTAGQLADTYGPIVRFATDPLTPEKLIALRRELGAEPCVVVGVDVCVGPVSAPDELERIESTVGRAPRASTAAAVLLRSQAHGSHDERIARESAVYSLLQGGPEFAEWHARRAARSPRPSLELGPVVVADRTGTALRLALNRPVCGNAVNRAVRDELCEALVAALLDPTCQVELHGAGQDFCTGGDLNEFGTFPDPATSHVLRLQRSPARLVSRLGRADRLCTYVHGRCIGSGIELAAFSNRLVATPDATFRLPEIGLGLVPGAGGTVSMTDRIGADRVLWMLLTDETIDASTALRWGLVDEVAG